MTRQKLAEFKYRTLHGSREFVLRPQPDHTDIEPFVTHTEGFPRGFTRKLQDSFPAAHINKHSKWQTAQSMSECLTVVVR